MYTSSIHLSTQVGSQVISFETGKLAKLADGAVTIRLGDTIIVVTVVSATHVKEGQDFFPLTVDYREKAASVGKFPGGYFKREGRPSEKEILTSRMIDRPLRPLFPKGYLYDTQVVALLFSADGQNDPDILSINGASAALMVSDIPWNGPIAAVRVGRVNEQFIVNPTHDQLAQSDLDLVYVGTEKEAIMIEGVGNDIPEQILKDALDFGQAQLVPLIQLQKELAQRVNPKKRTPKLMMVKEDLLEVAYQVAGNRIESAIYTHGKVARQEAVGALQEEVKQKILQQYPEATNFDINQAFDYVQKKAFRHSIFQRQQRCDGRSFDEVRPLHAETGFLPRSHGSSLFARGETQAICLATLAPLDEAQEIDAYTGGSTSKRFILHYNFPPFSVGETGRMGGFNRREIGHGALAERSIEPVLPVEQDFSYAIRVSSEVMESNGSTSMASVCAGTLALMDAGVPIKAPVAGISVGLVSEYDEKTGAMTRYSILTDILGSEDHYGDMDFKISGTRNGFTGLQLDLKLPGVPLSILKEGIDRARKARMHILDVMEQALSAPRPELSRYAPRIEVIKIAQDKIGLLIGPGGKTIKGIVAETGAEINIEDDGTVRIYSSEAEGMQRAKEIITGMVGDIEIGKLYHGRVVTIKEFGAFVEIFPGRDGLLHISEISDKRVNRVEDVLKVGDEIWVKCIGVDDKGRTKLSRKAAMKEKANADTA